MINSSFMDKEQMMTEEQKIKFSALFLDRFGIKIDTDNEMLPFYFIGYHSAIVSDENNKLAHQNIQKIIMNFEKRQEERGKQLDTLLEGRMKHLVELQSKMAQNSHALDLILTDFDKQLTEKLSQIKVKQYHFSDRGQAFWYSFGKFGLPIIVALILFFTATVMFIN